MQGIEAGETGCAGQGGLELGEQVHRPGAGQGWTWTPGTWGNPNFPSLHHTPFPCRVEVCRVGMCPLPGPHPTPWQQAEGRAGGL